MLTAITRRRGFCTVALLALAPWAVAQTPTTPVDGAAPPAAVAVDDDSDSNVRAQTPRISTTRPRTDGGASVELITGGNSSDGAANVSRMPVLD